jgi:spore germination protein GerM
MNPKWHVWLTGGLLVAVIAAAFYLPALRRQVNKAKSLTEKTAEQARRELLPPTPVTSGEPRVKAKMFWGSGANQGTLVPSTVDLPLSNDPTLRAKEILNTLLAGPVDPDARTLPPDAALLAFYILPDGTAVADFSEAFANSIPSGIQSEELAVDSITRTLEANVPQVRRLRILVHGQEVETLAGHLDLSQAFPVSATTPSTSKPSRSGLSVLTGPFKKAIDKSKGVRPH